MSPVTGLARFVGGILPSVHMANCSPVIELRFQLGNWLYEKCQLGYRDDKA